MNGKLAMLLGAVAVALVSQVAFSGSASAACKHGYKPMKHKSGNTVCVLDAAAGNNKLKAK
jgi:hypothetical protein